MKTSSVTRFFSNFAKTLFALKSMKTKEIQQILAFAAMCVDETAKAEGCSRRNIYQRLRKAGLMDGLTTTLDPLHTQSIQYVVEDLRNALHRLENTPKQN